MYEWDRHSAVELSCGSCAAAEEFLVPYKKERSYPTSQGVVDRRNLTRRFGRYLSKMSHGVHTVAVARSVILGTVL